MNCGGINRELTERERQLVQWLADGLTMKEIGRELGVTSTSVKTRMSVAVYPKLGADNAHHAVALAMRRGIIPKWLLESSTN